MSSKLKKGAAATSASGSKKTVAKGSSSKKGATGKGKEKSVSFHSSHEHLFEKTPRHFGIGRNIPPQRDLSRYVKWPVYIRLQRQRAILKKRLKVPPAINQFTKTLDKNQASQLFRLLGHYRPESHAEKGKRLKATAASEVKAEDSKDATVRSTAKPFFVKYGLNHITHLVETKKAKLVVIAHDVDPIELVVWLPALCRKLNVPYCIVKGKSRLGHLVHHKTAAAVAITDVKKEDQAKLDQIVQNVRIQYNDNVTDRKKWGGGGFGIKHEHVMTRRARVIAREAANKGQA